MWRRIATAGWKPADDPTIYGTLQIDATRALEYVRAVSQRSGRHVTITHLVTLAVARTLAAHPECNAFVRRGRIYQRDNVDVFVLVAVPASDALGSHDARADLAGVKIEGADRKNILQIAADIEERTRDLKRGKDRDFSRIKSLLAVVPTWLLRPALKLITTAQYELNLDLSRFGVPRDSFGGAFVTSLGPLGIRYGFPPIVPFTRLAVNVSVGRIEDGPMAENGRVVVRPLLPLVATFDHRVIDGYQAGRLAEDFCQILRDPERHLAEPPHADERSRVSVH